ncbi:Type I secretion system membrane fusion protein PrsE [Rubripirellula tenax]|uniref:Type I secretion system membrane fusion protein PrsE n=1 Tax=Rubripirellula tenax TaxID=2528015 RepID=A0A5C6EJB8_9BACT|nr:HlyD family efflux transporter periplasmic adaptor subunit [Rubripirellula tenax]TWU47359.1 Type I secretion system membrane fusion protein PrsE [Rubripirellula tenax]
MPNSTELVSDFPALQLVRTGRFIRTLGRLTFFLLTISIVAMVFAPWRQTARGTGSVVAIDPQDRPQPVMSPTKGVIRFVRPDLREGSYVEKDELLMRLAPFAEGGVLQIDTQIFAIDQKREAAELSLSVAEQAEQLQQASGLNLTESLNQDYRAANQKWEQAKNEVQAMQAELNDKRNQLRIAEAVASKGLIPQEELFSKRQAVEGQQAKVFKAESGAEEAYAALKSKEEEIESKKRDIDIKNREANQKVLESIQKLRTIEKEAIDLETKRDEFDRLDITAPRSGFIQQWSGLVGSDAIKEGDQLFTIVPDTDELGVEMKVTGNDMPLIHEGDRVRLQFEGWPAVQFVGWPSVAIGTFGGKVNRVFPTDDGKGNFRVLIVPEEPNGQENAWPDDRYLRQGVRANGWVLLKQVPLGYEIWRQLNGFPPVIANDEPGKSKDKGGKVKLPKG